MTNSRRPYSGLSLVFHHHVGIRSNSREYSLAGVEEKEWILRDEIRNDLLVAELGRHRKRRGVETGSSLYSVRVEV